MPGEDMLNAGADLGLPGVRSCDSVRHRLALRAGEVGMGQLGSFDLNRRYESLIEKNGRKEELITMLRPPDPSVMIPRAVT
jgi:hypothetical protein